MAADVSDDEGGTATTAQPDDLADDIRWAEQQVAEAKDELAEAERLLSGLRAIRRQREGTP